MARANRQIGVEGRAGLHLVSEDASLNQFHLWASPLRSGRAGEKVQLGLGVIKEVSREKGQAQVGKGLSQMLVIALLAVHRPDNCC